MAAKLEIHSLICKKDINLLYFSIKLFKYYSGLDFQLIIHEDGSIYGSDLKLTKMLFNDIGIENKIIPYKDATQQISNFLQDYPLCQHFRKSIHHTIFRIKLFDPFFFTTSHDILYLDSDILFCNYPKILLDYINKKTPFYLRDMSNAYCVPFRKEDRLGDQIKECVNAGLNYYPNKNTYNLNLIEDCLEVLYAHGSRDSTHPFLEQTCMAYMISKLDIFNQLPHPEYCVPTFGRFIANHGSIALHLNSSNLIGKYRHEHYEYELSKINNNYLLPIH